LDDQLFGTFSRCQDLLRQPPVQAESRAHLRQLLSVAAGGVVFTTIQKFLPEEKGDCHPVLSDRRNIVVIADEAHRSQYDFIDGFARRMRDVLPNASFIGFMAPPRTGRPEHEEPGCRAPPQTPRGRDQGGRLKNVVQARSFAELLERAVRRQNRAVEAVQVIEELIALAKEMRKADRRREQLGLSEEELAFYDALETNDSAVKVLGEPILKQIARELVETVRRNVTIDWAERENVRAHLRRLVKRVLRKYGYPPDKQEKATQTVLEQAEVLLKSERWVTESQ
jgi:type I restriction enzyme R subunit